jgi:bifunctional DNA-binding transcriptional regulator/antitoxin component of YhaV-PrlF toxin-antitoxin module
MSTTIEVEVDETNRILIPVELQNRLGLQPGMTLVVEAEQSGVALHVQSESALLVDKGGVLVAQVEQVGDITDVVRQERERQALDPVQRGHM